MDEPIILESQKPIQFEPYCIRCGCKTRGRYHLDNHDMVVTVASTFIPFFELVKTLCPSKIWVPFCYGCKLHFFLPGKKARFSILAFFICLGLGFYLFIEEMWQYGLICFAAAIYSLYYASKQNRVHTNTSLPISMVQEKDKIVYVFKSGWYYEYLSQVTEDENRKCWKSDFRLE